MKMNYLKNVVSLAWNAETCVGCGMCATVCPHAVFRMNGRQLEVVRRNACMECGACARNCPTGAVTVKAGVGCATGIINGWRRGGNGACCGEDGGCCCG